MDATQVPATTTSFTGRESDLAAVADALAARRLVTLVGPGGVGKTRLALEAAAGLDVVGVVELAAIRAEDDPAQAVLAACGLREDPERSPADRLVDALRDVGGVLVLDNAEHVRVTVAELVAAALRGAPALRVLATSRVTLGVAGETVVPVAPLPLDAATDLVLERARRVQPALADDAATLRAARAVAEVADGLPLALELAATHARWSALDEVARDAARLLALDAPDSAGRPRRHRSLRASLDWGLGQLVPAESAALGTLALVEGRITLGAALALIGGPHPGPLAALVDHSLVVFDAADARYLLLDTVREHVRTELADPSRDRAAADRLADRVAELAVEAGDGLVRADPATLQRLDRETSAVRAVLRRVGWEARDLERAAGIVADLAFWWALRGRCSEGRALAARVVAAHGAAGRPVPPPLGWAHAFLTLYAGDLEQGVALAAATAATATGAEDARARGRALVLVGMAQAFADPAAAEPVLRAAADASRTAGDLWGHVEAVQIVAYTHLHRSDPTAALAAADEVTAALARLDHPQLRAWDAAIRAEAAIERGDLDAAERFGREGHDLAVAVGEPVSAGCAFPPWARALCARGRAAEVAERLDTHAAFLAEHPGLGSGTVLDLVRAVVVQAVEGPAAALEALTTLVHDAEVAGLAVVAADAATLLAVAHLAAGDATAALGAASAARRGAAALGHREHEARADLVRAVARRRTGAPPRLADAEPARAAARVAPPDPPVTATEVEATGRAARAVLTTALDAGLPLLLVDALDVVAGLDLDDGHPAAAARLHGAADRLREDLGAGPSPLVALFRDADVRAAAEALGTGRHEHAVHEGARLDPVRAVAHALRGRGPRRRPRSGWDSLTPAERDVTGLVTRGLGNQAIADELLVGVGTVRTHLRSVFAKLGVGTRAELAALAARRAG